MKDRIPGKPGQYKATVAAAETQRILTGEEFTITLKRDDQPVVPGTPYSKAAVLPDTLAKKLCPNNADPTPADAFMALNQSVENIGSKSATGSMITLSDSGDAPLHALKIYGKTVQNGTPIPENPVPLESVGMDGSVTVSMVGKNLLNAPEEITFTRLQLIDLDVPLQPGTYTVSAVITSNDTDTNCNNIGFMGGESNGGNAYATLYRDTRSSATITIFNPVSQIRLNASDTAANSTGDTATYRQVQIEKGNVATAYEPYKGQTLTVSTPNGLPGIPVSSGGNYTDENGQQWIADYRDWKRGVDVQIIRDTTLNGSETWVLDRANVFGYKRLFALNGEYGMCSHYQFACNEPTSSLKDNQFTLRANGYIYCKNAKIATVDEWKAWLAANPIRLLYVFATPIETPIPEEEMAAYRALHTNYPNTTIFDDGGAYMEAAYYTPDSALPVNLGSGRAGQLLGVDELGGVTTLPNPTVESKEHPGCFYRMVNDIKEWINPPMSLGVPYRTTERHNGKAVYRKLINFGDFPQSTDKDVNSEIDANKYNIVLVHRNATEVGAKNIIHYLAEVTHEYIFVHSGQYWIHVTTNGSQAVSAEYLIEYVEV